MEENETRFYQLDKSKRYRVEGTDFRVGEAILLGVVWTVFFALAVAFFAIEASALFRDVHITVFAFVFLAFVILIAVFAIMRYRPVYLRRKRARGILSDCTLTDGEVLEVKTERVHTNNARRFYSYDAVVVKYAYYGRDGALRYGVHEGKYVSNPFVSGQNLMIAFHGEDSVILRKFALLEEEGGGK